MGKITRAKPVKLIVSFIFKEEKFFKKSKIILTRYFGELDFESYSLPFEFTDYYNEEMGSDLKKVFVSFKKLILPEQLPRIKRLTNKIEDKLSRKKKRQVNIDPGYLDQAKLVLASTKNYVHRVYLNDGIYAELTLFFQDKSFQPWQWTYPDYRTPEYIGIFNHIRELFADQVKSV
ncbi:MAG: DUF4416 family protein [Candidatus Omnitrophica bacterium]|nr:DUF4416 family protein [Candidatus Omnitrophota bacterium]